MRKSNATIIAIIVVLGVFITGTIYAVNYSGGKGRGNISKANFQQEQANTDDKNISTENQQRSANENEASKPSEESNGNQSTSELKIDSGRYVGRIDNNSIEIKISGVPEEKAARAFRVSESIKNEFDSYSLKKDDQIKVSYRLDKNNQPVIEKIEKIS